MHTAQAGWRERGRERGDSARVSKEKRRKEKRKGEKGEETD